eukprot:8297185-Lingulodinium_polyedra.AAC.1
MRHADGSPPTKRNGTQRAEPGCRGGWRARAYGATAHDEASPRARGSFGRSLTRRSARWAWAA